MLKKILKQLIPQMEPLIHDNREFTDLKFVIESSHNTFANK